MGFRSKKTLTGYRPDADERNFLFEWVAAAALELKPRIFLMENVPGMQSTKHEDLSFLEAAARMLRDKGGYRTDRTSRICHQASLSSSTRCIRFASQTLRPVRAASASVARIRSNSGWSRVR